MLVEIFKKFVWFVNSVVKGGDGKELQFKAAASGISRRGVG